MFLDYEESTKEASCPADGEYEAIVSGVNENATQNGKPFLEFIFEIRKDVSQDYGGCRVKHRIWHKKEPTEKDIFTNGYSYKYIMWICCSAKVDKSKDYKGFDDVCGALLGRPVKITVQAEQYNGYDIPKVVSFSEAEFPVDDEFADDLFDIGEDIPF